MVGTETRARPTMFNPPSFFPSSLLRYTLVHPRREFPNYQRFSFYIYLLALTFILSKSRFFSPSFSNDPPRPAPTPQPPPQPPTPLPTTAPTVPNPPANPTSLLNFLSVRKFNLKGGQIVIETGVNVRYLHLPGRGRSATLTRAR